MKETFQLVENMKREGVLEDYAVAGAVGALFYVEPFATLDIDFLVNFPSSGNSLVSLEPIFSWLRERGYSEFDENGNIVVGKWPIQFLPVHDEFSAEALREAQYLPFDETLNVRVIRPEYLATEALRMGRPKDIGRLADLLLSEEFNADRFSELRSRFGLERKWTKIQPFIFEE